MAAICWVLSLVMLAGYPAPFMQDGKWGYKDSRGKVVIQPRFEVAEKFSPEGLAAVVDEKGWAYIDAGGKVVIRPLVVDNGTDCFKEGLARFRTGGSMGFFNKRGQVVIQARFAFAQPFSEGLAAACEGCQEVPEGEHAVMRGGTWGFIDKGGAVIIPFQFEEAERFKDGRANVKSRGQWKSIDKKGGFVQETSIGSAWMEPDGTIVLQLRAEGPGATVGDALLRYPKAHPQYASILHHLGGLKLGQVKPVPPWPNK